MLDVYALTNVQNKPKILRKSITCSFVIRIIIATVNLVHSVQLTDVFMLMVFSRFDGVAVPILCHDNLLCASAKTAKGTPFVSKHRSCGFGSA